MDARLTRAAAALNTGATKALQRESSVLELNDTVHTLEARLMEANKNMEDLSARVVNGALEYFLTK